MRDVRVVVWKNATLVTGLRYNVRLLAAASDDDATGIRAIDGAPREKEYAFAFTAGDPAKMAPDAPVQQVRAVSAWIAAGAGVACPAMP